MSLVAVQGDMMLEPSAAAAWAGLKAAVLSEYGVALRLSSPAGAWRSEALVLDMYLNPARYGATKGVAKPKSLGGPGSVHENGRCVDINNWAALGLKNLEPIAARHGFVRTIPKEQWHFEYRGGGSGGGVLPPVAEEEAMSSVDSMCATLKDGTPAWCFLNWATGKYYAFYTQEDANWIGKYMGSITPEFNWFGNPDGWQFYEARFAMFQRLTAKDPVQASPVVVEGLATSEQVAAAADRVISKLPTKAVLS